MTEESRSINKNKLIKTLKVFLFEALNYQVE
jgi:hypothetical protein